MAQPQIPSDLAAAAEGALRKRQAGQTLSRSEQRTLDRYRALIDERRRWETYAAIPQKDWLALCQRQHKQVREQAETYGFPFGHAAEVIEAIKRSGARRQADAMVSAAGGRDY